MTEEDRQVYEHIRKLAQDGNYAELKKIEYINIKMAYGVIGANYNFTNLKQLPKWMRLIKRVRDELIADELLTKQAEDIINMPTE